MTDTTPAPRLADTDWSRFKAEADALAEQLQAQHPALTAREAGDIAADEVERRYAAELVAAAEQAAAVEQARADAKRAASVERAAAKAAYHLAGGLDIRRAPDGAYLVPSGTRAGAVHVVSADGQRCSCEAGQAARPCWHVEAVAQVEAEQAPARVTFRARFTLTRAA